MVDQVLKFLGGDLKALRTLLAAVNHGGNAPIGAKFLDLATARQGSRISVQRYRFHFFKKFGVLGALNWCARL